jgi:hypothetical protein
MNVDGHTSTLRFSQFVLPSEVLSAKPESRLAFGLLPHPCTLRTLWEEARLR